MKVLMINGSPKGNGCIHTALSLAAEVLKENGIETEEIHVGNKDIRGCIACMKCRETHLSQGHDFLHYHGYFFITTFFLLPAVRRLSLQIRC